MKPVSSPGQLATDRLAFLDVLRCLAATAVLLHHGFAVAFPGYLDLSVRYFDLGQFGVTLFMLISGFIIPMSLERGGSNVRFWISRICRLFPLYWASIAFCLLYFKMVCPEQIAPPETWQWLVNLTMLQEFARVPHVIAVFWTLALELTFYASCSLLFALGLSRRTWHVVWFGQASVLVVAVCYPLVFDRRFPGGYAILFLSMFVGTLFHRYLAGEVSRRQLLLVLSTLVPLALAVAFVCFSLFTRVGHQMTWHCVFAFWLAAYLAFAVGLSCRNRPMPSWLCYLGKVSYSIYLVHACLVLALPPDWPAPVYLGLLIAGTWTVSAFTYRFIEKPGMELGRRLCAMGRPSVVVRSPDAAFHTKKAA